MNIKNASSDAQRKRMVQGPEYNSPINYLFLFELQCSSLHFPHNLNHNKAGKPAILWNKNPILQEMNPQIRFSHEEVHRVPWVPLKNNR